MCRFEYIQGTADLKSELDLEDRWVVAGNITPTCFYDDFQNPTTDYENLICYWYPFAIDSSMKLAQIFQVLAVIFGFLSGMGAIVAYCAIENRRAPVRDPIRWIPALLCLVTSVLNVLTLIIFRSKTLCQNVSQSQNALIIVQPYCYMSCGGYFSIIASISWLICAPTLLISDPDPRQEWETVPTDLKLTAEMTTVGGNRIV